MKKIIALLFAVTLIASCFTNKQSKPVKYFEGNIKYKLDYEIKTDKVTPDYIHKIMAKTSDVYFKNGNVYQKYDGGIIMEELFRVADNKNYVRYSASPDTLKWVSCSYPDQEIVSYEINPNKETILGILCSEYVVHYKHRTTTFYFNADTLQLNPAWYKQFTLTNKNINAERMKANYLKFKLEYPDFWISFTATSINALPINDTMFDIKPNTILAKDETYQ